MKQININTSEIVRLLSDGGVFAGLNRAITALNNVRITTNNGRIRVESSSDDNYIRVYGTCNEGTENMSFCVNPKELSSYLRLVGDTDVCLTYNEEKSMLKVKHSHGSMKTPTFDFNDFPVMQVAQPENMQVMPAQILTTWLNTAQQFVLQKNFGTALGGVNLRVGDGKLTVVGADHGLIYMADCPMEQSKDFSVVIPKEGTKVMASMCAGVTDVEIGVTDNALIVKNADFTLYIRLIDVKYPNLHRLAEHKGGTVFKFDAQTLRQAARRVAAQTDSKERRMRVSFAENELLLCYDYPQMGKHVEETVVGECPAFETPVIINIDFLLNVINNNVDEELVFYHDDNERSAFYFESVGESFTSTFLLGTMV